MANYKCKLQNNKYTCLLAKGGNFANKEECQISCDEYIKEKSAIRNMIEDCIKEKLNKKLNKLKTIGGGFIIAESAKAGANAALSNLEDKILNSDNESSNSVSNNSDNSDNSDKGFILGLSLPVFIGIVVGTAVFIILIIILINKRSKFRSRSFY